MCNLLRRIFKILNSLKIIFVFIPVPSILDYNHFLCVFLHITIPISTCYIQGLFRFSRNTTFYVQVCFEGDPEAALITYANRYEAVAAYKSTVPILNNRFIKVFWHSTNGQTNNTVNANQVIFLHLDKLGMATT